MIYYVGEMFAGTASRWIQEAPEERVTEELCKVHVQGAVRSQFCLEESAPALSV